jgi:hypothetical protein
VNKFLCLRVVGFKFITIKEFNKGPTKKLVNELGTIVGLPGNLAKCDGSENLDIMKGKYSISKDGTPERGSDVR